MSKTNILKNGTLDLVLLSELTQKPALSAPGEPLFWNDPHISKQMLDSHLNPTWDAASRNHDLIDREIQWLAAALPVGKDAQLLDLGCGPGLYCSRLRRLGYDMTGMDYSQRSIDYARRSAMEQGLVIDYIYQDYLTLEIKEKFDAALMINYDLGVLSICDLDTLLGRVHRALKPGGYFVFDLFTPANRDHQTAKDWSVKREGFWRPDLHMVLTQSFHYPEAETYVHQYAVIEPSGLVTIYRNWDHCYTPATISPILAAHGFSVEGIWADLTGKPYADGSTSLAVMARKQS